MRIRRHQGLEALGSAAGSLVVVVRYIQTAAVSRAPVTAVTAVRKGGVARVGGKRQWSQVGVLKTYVNEASTKAGNAIRKAGTDMERMKGMFVVSKVGLNDGRTC